ncbi:hypothetical protein [Leptodesmis sichuanensis]|uniref:hypothetical protein n=1 Tax=Leptodesmis sichuanensis TaxID=2906798 RepID=UPI001F3A63EB|nr:hypothetical protein [Leptodesmis sichuanensis]UIE36774.1 hypothetical protein KIK02_17335 [Leptodesmis sichuanensis A121]
MAISLRGVARRYRGITGGFSVAASLGRGSLRSRLVSLARQEHRFNFSECIYGGTAAFEQTWSHIIIRIRLNPDAGISDATMNTLRNTWRNGIQTTWSDRWGVRHPGEMTCPLTFEVQWVTTNEHHAVRVRQCPAGEFCRSNTGLWDTNDTGAVAAHECGHFFGLADEYADANCPNRNPVNTGTIMDNNSNVVPARMMTRFANNIGSNVVAI